MSIFNKIDVLIADAFNNVFQRRQLHLLNHFSIVHLRDNTIEIFRCLWPFKVTSHLLRSPVFIFQRISTSCTKHHRYHLDIPGIQQFGSADVSRNLKWCTEPLSFVEMWTHSDMSLVQASPCAKWRAPLQSFYYNSPMWSMTDRPVFIAVWDLAVCTLSVQWVSK